MIHSSSMARSVVSRSNVNKTANPSTVQLSDAATRVFLAVYSNHDHSYWFGYDKLSYITNLPLAQLRKGVAELVAVGHLESPKQLSNRRLLLKLTSQAVKQPPALAPIESGEAQEIAKLAVIDYDEFGPDQKRFPVQFIPECDFYDEPEDIRRYEWPGIWSMPVGTLRVLITSSDSDYLDYLLYGPECMLPPVAGRPRGRAQTNWSPEEGEHANDPRYIDTRTVTDFSLAGYWAWCMGYQRCLVGQNPELPHMVDAAYYISGLLSTMEATFAIDLLNFAGFNWRKVARSPRLRHLKLDRLPTIDCWVEEDFDEILRQSKNGIIQTSQWAHRERLAAGRNRKTHLWL